KLLTFADSVENDAARVGSVLAGDDVTADALAPDLELLHCGGPEGVPRGEQHLVPFADELRRELADGGRLPGPVHAHQEHDRRLRAGHDRARAAIDLEDAARFSAEGLPDLGGIAQVTALEVFPDPIEDRPCGADAHVGGEEHFLDLLGDALVDLPGAGEEGAEPTEEPLLGPGAGEPPA